MFFSEVFRNFEMIKLNMSLVFHNMKK